MLRIFAIIGILFLCLSGSLSAQMATEVGNKRTLPSDSYYQQVEQTPSEVYTIRIEKGQLWLNGNLQKPKELPKSLQTIDPNYLFEARLWGSNELKFTLFGNEYLLKKGKLVEMPHVTPLGTNRQMSPDMADKENYYSVYKEQAPSLWQAWQMEAQLTLDCRQLLMEYEFAQDLEKEAIRKQLEKKMSFLFDLQVANEEAEIRQIEKELESLKKELEFRKKNKQLILDKRIKELTEE